jgi:Restriction endonuclease
MYSFAALTDHDFELLVADLLGAEEQSRYEVFARGPDLGVDLRRVDDEGGVHVVQCKQYVHSTIADLRKAARSERKKLERLTPRPVSYRFVTSRRLTVANKRDLRADLAAFIRRDDDVLGEHDLELLLDRHTAVQRRHIKLWLSSAAQLRALLESATYSRSKALAEEIADLLPRWVPGEVFFAARELLHKERVCVVAGVPGIGKTTLAKMLLADAIDSGYEPISVSADIEEAWSVYEPGQRQIFYYDDFLGRTARQERGGPPARLHEAHRGEPHHAVCADHPRVHPPAGARALRAASDRGRRRTPVPARARALLAHGPRPDLLQPRLVLRSALAQSPAGATRRPRL